MLFFGFLSSAQNKSHYSRISAGAGTGLTLLFGDIGNMGMGYNVHLEASYSLGNWSVRASFLYGKVADNDEGTANAGRNYAYRTTLWQPSVQAPYTFYREKHKGFNKKGLAENWDRWRVDAIGGIAFPYRFVTPGNNFSPNDPSLLRGFSLSIPLGAGVQYGFSENMAVRVELMPQFNFSDYLDGYASPYSKANDFMYFVSCSFIYHFPGKHKKGAVYCPYDK